MSDFERVQIDAQQFTALDQRLNAIQVVMAHIERTLFDGLKAIAQGSGSGGDNSQVLTAINNLDRKVSEFMATQEERLQSIQAGLTSVADGVNTLQQQIADLKASNPALDDEISAIEATVKGIADDINGVTEPPTEPPVEG